MQQHDVGRALSAARKRFVIGTQAGLYVAYSIIAKVACQTAGKTGHAGQQRNLETGLVGLDEIQWIAFISLYHLPVLHHLGMVAGGPDEGMSGQADKGITAKTFTAQDRKSTRLNSSHVAISYAV